jgi:tetratricopeptide (TPR) repeat protein
VRRRILNLAIAIALILAAALCHAQSPNQNLMEKMAGGEKPRSGFTAMGESISSGFKKGFQAVSKPFQGATADADDRSDPTRLGNKAKPGAELYTAVAASLERRGMFQEAERQYQKGLAASPNHLDTMLAYGQFLDRRSRLKEATEMYQRAIKAHPDDPRPYNHLGLCLASHGALDQAAAAMDRAVRLDPTRPVYRNNIAAILVEKGDNRTAFGHLRAVHDEATAYYNLGYLLQKRGDNEAAMRHFAVALKRNPEMKEALVWMEHLRRATPEGNAAAAQLARRTDVGAAVTVSPPVQQPSGVPTQPPVAPQQQLPVAPQPRLAPQPQAPLAPPQQPVLQQPAQAAAPVYQATTQRFTSAWPAQAAEPLTADRRAAAPPVGPPAVSMQPAPTPSAPIQVAPAQPAPIQVAPAQPAPMWIFPTDARPPVTSAGQQPTAPASQPTPAPQQPTTAAGQATAIENLRWASLFNQPGQTQPTSRTQATPQPVGESRSSSSAPLPSSTQVPATPIYGAPETNVIYPLPPVETTTRR